MTRWPWTLMKSFGAAAIAVSALFTIGCGPAPGYEGDAQSPAGQTVQYQPVGTSDPPTSEQLAAQQQAQIEAGQQVAASGAQPGPNDVQIGATGDEYTDTDPAALTDFRPALDGHGQWVDDSTYGTVWVPASTEVGSDFQPYVTAGHWTYGDDDGWVWVSDYDWGWAPFHYGRWVLLPGYGWSWIPGRVYSGAWVTWRTGAYDYDYVGWAPMGPSWYWYGGVAYGWGFGWYHPYYGYCGREWLGRPGFEGHWVRGGTPAAAPIEARTAPFQSATPTVAGAGRVAASPRVAGPTPQSLGIKNESISRPPSDNHGLAQARTFASPATAMRAGASPPAGSRMATRATAPRDAMTGSPGAHGAGGPSMGARSLEPAARAPQYSSNGRSFSSPSYSSPRYSSPSYSSPRSFSTSPSYSSPRYSSPSYSSPRSFSTSPSYSPHYSTPSYSQRSVAPHYSAPTVHSTPSYHAPAMSAPSHSYSSTPSRSMRSGGGGHRR